MDTREFVVQVIQYGAWPLTVLAIVLLFRSKLASLFSGGLKSAKHKDTEVHFYENPQAAPPESTTPSIQNLVPPDPTGLREELVSRIQTQLSNVADDREKIELLTKNLAQQQINSHLDKIYYNIFGSQIQVLEYLSEQPDGSASNESILEFFNDAKQNNPGLFDGGRFSDYMNFMVTWHLVASHDGQWEILPHGRAFIAYITAMQMSKLKAF